MTKKEKEIDMLKSQNQFFMEETKRLNQIVSIQRNDKSIRHQICEEIRKKLKAHCDYSTENGGWHIPEYKIDILLDQIEEGEGK